ncbi:serine hydrolase [Amycolatopsis sp. NPDC059021]|uniref:serine hydrolase n=1 Tax=Amycolatopsis sp. NPDC059021 TaxID=3346704 RepID=UPI0036713074
MGTREDTIAEIQAEAARAGVRVWLHAQSVDGGPELGIGDEDPVVTASVFKVPVAVELARQAATGAIDLAEQVTVRPGEGPPSPYGLATFPHETTLSWDALAGLMISVSDNVATDLVLGKVTKESVKALLADLQLPGTAVPANCAELLSTVAEDLGIDYADDERALSDLSAEQLACLRALDPAQTCRSTPAETTRLLEMIWRDEAAPPAACADVRRWLGGQVWPHRLRSGFTGDDVRVSGKTGTLPTVRNESGVVEFDGGGRYAVAVFTRAEDARSQVPARDAFIGFAGAKAVEWLRGNVPA